jgi:hypothetical protein
MLEVAGVSEVFFGISSRATLLLKSRVAGHQRDKRQLRPHALPDLTPASLLNMLCIISSKFR